MHITLGTAGLSEELALRLSLACGLLAASQIHVELQDWRGGESDMLIVDNRSAMHKAGFDYDHSQHRMLYRILVRGDRPY